MCHCITPEALLYGLLKRVETEGYEPTRDDVRGVIGSGCRTEVALAAVAQRLDGARAARFRALIEEASASAGT